VRIQLLGELRPIFESQGLPVSDIGAVGNEKEHRSSLASIAAAPNTELTDQVSVGSVPQEKPLVATSGPSLEPDTIDTLALSTPCNLIITISGDYRMEVGKCIIYPRMYTLDDVPIDSVSFTVVKVDMVHENAKNLNLEVEPDDTTLTLRVAVTRRVQWRTPIDVDPQQFQRRPLQVCRSIPFQVCRRHRTLQVSHGHKPLKLCHNRRQLILSHSSNLMR
jgi:hypothetical protein